ncbi:MAG: FtsX-like permease family protein [Treponema sp.]|nr:FtsX-like permease family protein [Treponema sp.]
MMVFFLALRNIIKNKKNNTIIILLIAIICFIFFIGNSIIEKSNLGLHKAFISSLTGDVALQKKSDINMNLFGANAPVIDPFFIIPVFPAYDAVMDIINSENGITGITSQVSGKAFLDFLGVREPVLLCGVDAQTYFEMFPGIILEQGRFLQSGEYGAMITLDRAQRIERRTGIFPNIGDSLLFTSGGDYGFKIREVPLTGIFSYQNPGLFMNEIVIIDPQTVRVLNSIQVATSQDVNLNDDSWLFTSDIDDIFNMDTFDSQPSVSAEGEFSADFLQSWLSENTVDDIFDMTGGDWNFILINLESNISPSAFINSINKKLEPYGVIAVDWRISVGISAILLLLIQVLFNAGIFLVCVAGVITIINILLIYVFRRTREIGTLRAIGASDFYISSLVLLENIILSVAAGIAGILIGFIFISILNSLSLVIPNDLIASLLGGHILTLEFIPHIAIFSFLLAVLFGIIASIYPIYITLRIEPMEAVRQG